MLRRRPQGSTGVHRRPQASTGVHRGPQIPGFLLGFLAFYGVLEAGTMCKILPKGPGPFPDAGEAIWRIFIFVYV